MAGWGQELRYGVAFGNFNTSTEPVVTTTETSTETTIGLPSPLGDKIPQGIGTFPVSGQLIVDPDLLGSVSQSDTATRVNLVLGFCETSLGGTVQLINLKANDAYIYRTEAPTRSFPGTIRFYGGNQSALDPLLSSHLSHPTYWPKLSYAVLEGFDIAPYGNQLPSFTAELATVATVSTLSHEEATLTFGATFDGSGAHEHAIDKVRNHYYTSDFNNATGDVYVVTFDIATNTEVCRAKLIHSTTIYYTGYWVSLDGSDYIVGALTETSLGLYRMALINTVTGQVVTLLANLEESGTTFEPYPMAAQLIASDVATKYIVYSDALGTIDNGNARMMVTIADITAGTLTNIAHQFSNPVAAAGSGETSSLALGPVIGGQAIIFFVVADVGGGEDNVVWKAQFSQAAVVSASTVFTGTDCRGVAYDFSDGRIVFYEADGTLTKVSSTGGTVYSVATGITLLRINYRVYETGGQFQFKTRQGYAAGRVFGGDGEIYLIDLSDGSASLVIDEDDYVDRGYDYYDQTMGYFVTEYSVATDPGMTRWTLPQATIPTSDLQNIYTKLAEYRGKFSSSDLIFDGFTGGECYGVVYSSDTTLDNAEQDANNIFDVKIVPSDGKRKYVKAKRDGSFALDDTIDADAIVEQADFNVQKTMDSDEQSLAGARISYIDRNANFERTDQEYRRPVGIYSVTRSDRVEDVSTNFVLSSEQAMQAVTTKVYRSNFGLDIYSFTLAPEKFYLEPADIVQFDFEGFTIIGQINEANLSGELFTQELTVTQYVQAIDASFAGIDINLPDLADPSRLTRFLYLDAPLLSLGDDLGGAAVRQYAMMSGYGYTAFQGATLYRSFDGQSYSVVTSRYGVTPVIGVLKALTGSPDATIEAIDHTSVLQVAILSGDTDDLATITEAQMLAGGNKALIGKAGRWILIHFQTVSVTDKIATISNIVWSSPFYQAFLDSLAAGDYFVLLQTGHHVRFSGDVTKLGDEIFYKAATDAFPITSVPTESHTLIGRAEMPFPPLHLNAVIDGSDIDLSWDWRSRLYAGSILPGSDNSPLGEATLAFEIDIMDGSTVKRTLTATTNSKTYLDADITTDFGSMPDELTFRVYQISALVGRGYVAEKTISFGGAGSVGAASGAGAAAAVGQAGIAAVGAASGVGAATGVSAAASASVGASSGAASAAAVGASVADAVAAASGASTTEAVAGLPGDGSGDATGSSTAQAVGASAAAATASAVGAGAASGVGASAAAAVGSAAGTSTAAAVADSDPYFSSVVLLCGFNGADGATSSTDESNAAHSLTFVGNAQLDTAQFKFGSASLLLDGTGDRVESPDSLDWQLGSTNSSPWTIECWVRWNVLDSSNRGIMGQAGSAGWTLTGTASGGQISMAGSNFTTVTTTGTAMTTGVWYHVAVDHDATGKIRVYIDGVMRGSATPANSAIVNDGTALALGAQTAGGIVDMNGWLDEVRITKGVARYASDSGFTPPTAAFPRS
ncbi:concanavalin A-like lectin/glucanase family/phage tail domain-containing protein [Rhizobium sp. TAL182]|uniref:LamG-like jellyroll fold domain-containing protein n=1 Tax=Rhizobium sp. TAL182 TaxID=2020313 RepID=UPI000A20F5B0|nr:LamG-like jellyroll fold domain-containing protein [Rhizobium sp. TAL182]ARO24735.1 concanavalin A-like lectin/glucanase family/phage tail domain-containing protein [Rhizobium sp. TAL182]